MINFNNERTAVVTISCFSFDKVARCPPIGSLKDGASEQDVLRKLERVPFEERIYDSRKVLTFPRLGVKLTLRQDRVGMLTVYDP
jgi:hypothetical protein